MHNRPGSARTQRTRVELNDYDENLLLDRSYVHTPVDGFGEEEDSDRNAEQFGPLHTSWAVFLYLACLGLYLVFLLSGWPTVPHKYTFSIQATAHIAILMLAMLLESFLRLKHRRRQQMGYLQFYRKTRHLLSVPFQASAVASGLVLLVSLWPEVAPGISRHAKLVAIAAAETAVAVVFTVLYVSRLTWHNQKEAAPDAQHYLQSSLYTPPSSGTRRQDAVVEQQGEVIRFLQRRCDNLARTLLHLQAQEDSRYEEEQQGDACALQEVTHVLAAREQEFRALLAEKESLLGQNREAWTLLEGRAAEIDTLQVQGQQHVEENARLRSTLEEWSHRNAKLEKRLNVTQAQLDDCTAQLQHAKDVLAVAHSSPDR